MESVGRHAPILLEMAAARPFLLRLIEAQHCQLVGNFFGYAIQATLGVFAFSSLILKKVTDTEKRTWLHWSRDTSKQALGSLIVHVSNLLISYFLVDETFSDPCVFYMVTFVVDSILGTIWSIVWVKGIEYVDARWWHTGHLQSGFYGRPPSCKTWGIQTLVWILITTVGKIVLLWGIVEPFESQLYAAGLWLMSPFLSMPRVELVMVMVVIPVVLNSVVFWQTDRWIMNSSHSPELFLPPDMDDEFPCLITKHDEATSTDTSTLTTNLLDGPPAFADGTAGESHVHVADEGTQTVGNPLTGEGVATITSMTTADASSPSSTEGSTGVASVSSGTAITASAPLVGGASRSNSRRQLLAPSAAVAKKVVISSTSSLLARGYTAPAQRLRAQDYHRL